jgi:hypothetical protein
MNLYLDDDSGETLLVRLLRAQGHNVTRPIDVEQQGETDVVHLRFCIGHGLVLVSKNHQDFLDLHQLVIESGGHHPGILVIRRANDSSRDLTSRGVANALRKLIQPALPVQDCLHVLNQWR